MAIPEVPTRSHPLSPEALKQEGYARNKTERRTSPSLTWEEQHPIDFRFHPSPTIMMMERVREDKQDPAYLSVNGDEKFQRYETEHEDELRLLDAKLQEFGMKLPGAGTRLATWGERGHAFEIAKDRVCIYMYFPKGDKPGTIIEFRFRRNDPNKLLIWDYGKNSVEKNTLHLLELGRVDYETGKKQTDLVIPGRFNRMTIGESGQVSVSS